MSSNPTETPTSSNSIKYWWSALKEASDRPWMGVYLRILAIIFAYGGLVHIANIAGFGEMPWNQMPLTWQVGDIAYAILDIVAAIGLWKRTVWGAVCMLCAVLSQFVIYTVFLDYFAFTLEQRQTIYILLIEEGILILIFSGLLLVKK
ncbi:MAG: DUF6163 family protein [Cyanobacteriota bacterium]|nr:DUF6163 family protein [Cyanobacteriota bacterium]